MSPEQKLQLLFQAKVEPSDKVCKTVDVPVSFWFPRIKNEKGEKVTLIAKKINLADASKQWLLNIDRSFST